MERNISRDEFLALRKLGTNANLVFLKPDKGNGVVVLNKCDYLTKANKILNDESKFKKVLVNDTEKLEAKLNRLLDKLHKCNHIDKSTYESLRATGSRPGCVLRSAEGT